MSFIIFANFCSNNIPSSLTYLISKMCFMKTKKNSGSGITSKVEKTTCTVYTGSEYHELIKFNLSDNHLHQFLHIQCF